MNIMVLIIKFELLYLMVLQFYVDQKCLQRIPALRYPIIFPQLFELMKNKIWRKAINLLKNRSTSTFHSTPYPKDLLYLHFYQFGTNNMILFILQKRDILIIFSIKQFRLKNYIQTVYAHKQCLKNQARTQILSFHAHIITQNKIIVNIGYYSRKAVALNIFNIITLINKFRLILNNLFYQSQQNILIQMFNSNFFADSESNHLYLANPTIFNDTIQLTSYHFCENLQISQFLNKESENRSTSSPETSKSQQNQKKINSFQSILHNCPKNAIKILIKILKSNYKILLTLINKRKSPETTLIKDLLKILIKHRVEDQSSSKKQLSKQVIKLIFQQDSERKNFFQRANFQNIFKLMDKYCAQDISCAKSILRKITSQLLLQNKDRAVGQSRIENKSIMLGYLDCFLNEIKEGIINLRIPKQQKLMILQKYHNQFN